MYACRNFNVPAELKRDSIVLVPSAADPGSGAFLTPGSRMGKKSGSGTGIRDKQPGSYYQELRNNFFGLKYLNSLMRIRDPGWEKFGSGIRNGENLDLGWKNFGSRLEKIRIRDGKIRIRDPQLLVPMLADILGGFFHLPSLRQPIGRRNSPIIWQ